MMTYLIVVNGQGMFAFEHRGSESEAFARARANDDGWGYSVLQYEPGDGNYYLVDDEEEA